MASWFGSSVRVQLFGQSHSPAVGVVVDGLPAGEYVDLERLGMFMARRAPGRTAWSTPRSEADVPRPLSGLNPQGRTCGAPLAFVIENTNAHSKDYAQIARNPRPGHADLTAQARWHGEQDVAGGGHFSGRLTAPLCAAGGVALQILERKGIFVGAHVACIAGIRDVPFDPVHVGADVLSEVAAKPFPVVDDESAMAMQATIAGAKAGCDSVGGIVECACVGLPAGVGSPMFGGVESRVAQALFGVPAVKGVEFGAGFGVADLYGSQNNDPYELDGRGRVRASSNNAGGILGGITNGMPLVVRAAFKPTPSIALDQRTVDLVEGGEASLAVEGRHDPCVVVRAVPVVEAVVALVVLDMLVADGLVPVVNDACKTTEEIGAIDALFGRGDPAYRL